MADVNSLVAGDAAAFEGLLQMLMSSQNEQRSHAEKLFAELKKHPDACANQLVRSLRTSPNVESRSLCAVLLRKVCVCSGATTTFIIHSFSINFSRHAFSMLRRTSVYTHNRC